MTISETVGTTLVAAVAWFLSSVAVSAQNIRTIASYPSGTFLENMSVSPAGDMYFTSYFDETIYVWSGAGAPTTFQQVDGHPVGIVVDADEVVLTVHGLSFLEGANFTATNRFVVLDTEGAPLRDISAPDALFLNGMTQIAPGKILAADSLAGKIWVLDTEKSTVSEWLSDPMLLPAEGAPPFSLGANGLKIRDGQLYISNSSRRALYRIALSADKPSGGLELFSSPGSIDDFAFLEDGSIAAASHGQALLHIATDGTVTNIIEQGCDSCTAVLPYGPKKDLVFLTTGDLLEGGKKPAQVLTVPSPAAR